MHVHSASALRTGPNLLAHRHLHDDFLRLDVQPDARHVTRLCQSQKLLIELKLLHRGTVAHDAPMGKPRRNGLTIRRRGGGPGAGLGAGPQVPSPQFSKESRKNPNQPSRHTTAAAGDAATIKDPARTVAVQLNGGCGLRAWLASSETNNSTVGKSAGWRESSWTGRGDQPSRISAVGPSHWSLSHWAMRARSRAPGEAAAWLRAAMARTRAN